MKEPDIMKDKLQRQLDFINTWLQALNKAPKSERKRWIPTLEKIAESRKREMEMLNAIDNAPLLS